MSGFYDSWLRNNPNTDHTAGKTPQTGEERLARFREELGVEIAKFDSRHRGAAAEIQVLRKIQERANEQSLLGVADQVIDNETFLDFDGVRKAVKNAHDRATRGTYLDNTPVEQNAPYVSEARKFEERRKSEKPKETTPQERFSEVFLTMIGDYASRIGHSEATNNQQTRARALRYAAKSSDGVPTIKRIGTKLIAWHQGKVKGEETNKIDANATQGLYQKAKTLLGNAEKSTNFSTQDYIEQATPLITGYVQKAANDDALDPHQKNALKHFAHLYHGDEAKNYSPLDYLHRTSPQHLDKKLEPLEDIIRNAVAHAHKKINAPTSENVATFEASAEGEAPTTNDNIPEGVNPEIVAASQAMADPAKATALMDAMRGGPLEEAEVEELSFSERLAMNMEELDGAFTDAQATLLNALKENGCLNKSDIFKIANDAYSSGNIDREEAQYVLQIAEEIWDQAERSGNTPEFRHGSLDERPSGYD